MLPVITAEVGETSKTLAPKAKTHASRPEHSLSRHLLSKQELSLVLGISPRTLDTWMAQKRIPFLRLSPRLIKFNLPRVEAALARYEVREIGGRS